MHSLHTFLSFVLSLGLVKGQENPCTDYVSSKSRTPCNATLNTCFFSNPKTSKVEMLDACLTGIFIEDKLDTGFPNGNMSGDIGSPVVGQAVPTNFPGNPLLGSFTGREEPMFHLRPLVPMQPADLNTTFYLYVTTYQDGEEAIPVHYSFKEATGQMAARRYPMDTLYVIAHDFNEDIGTRDQWIYHRFRDLLFNFEGSDRSSRARPTDVTGVLLVDWKEGAKARNETGKFYRQAAVNTMIVGRELGLLLHVMIMSSSRLTRENVHLIGNGLGAHVMHFASNWYKLLANRNSTHNPVGRNEPVRKLGRLTALDPFAPHFQGFINLAGNVPHVYFQDATFVDIIHTSSTTATGSVADAKKSHIGMALASGHVDIYVNGGREQPACSSKESARLINPRYVNSICSHKYALFYFLNSLLDKPYSCSTPALKVSSWASYVKANLLSQKKFESRYASKSTFLGILTPAYSARGEFFLYLVVNSEDFSDHVISAKERVEIISAMKPKKVHSDYERITEIPLKAATGEYPAIFPSHQDSIPEIRMNSDDLPDCGLFRAPSDGRVRGGHPAYVGQFPWTVCILLPDEEDDELSRGCTGSILNEHWIVTAAHCFSENLVNKLLAISFSISCENDLESSNPTTRKFRYKPDINVFTPEAFIEGERWDIALVRLKDPIAIPAVYDGGPVNSICWQSANQFPYNFGDKLIFAGFGDKGPTADSDSLTWMDISVSKNTDHNLAIVLTDFQRSSKFRGYGFYQSFVIPPRLPCGGDSGGPYMWYVKTSNKTTRPNVSPYRAVLVGTEVSGDDCDFPALNEKTGIINLPETGTLVGQADVRGWMMSIVKTRTYNIDARSFDVATLIELAV